MTKEIIFVKNTEELVNQRQYDALFVKKDTFSFMGYSWERYTVLPKEGYSLLHALIYTAQHVWDRCGWSSVTTEWAKNRSQVNRICHQLFPSANPLENSDGEQMELLNEDDASQLEAMEETYPSSSPSSFSTTLQDHGFSEAAVGHILRSLGQAGGKKGETELDRLAANGYLILEPIGTDKKGNPKFYLLTDEILGEGGFSTCQKAFSRKGTERAVRIPVDCSEDDSSAPESAIEQRSLGHIKTLSKAKQPGASGIPGISRLMGEENGTTVFELGGCNLSRLFEQRPNLSQQERLCIYRDLFKGLSAIHRLELVHRDIKLENVVALFDSQGKVIGCKIIDFGFLSKKSEIANEPGYSFFGSPAYASPEKMAWCLGDPDAPIESRKADVWAAMVMICLIETKFSQKDSLLSAASIKRFEEYYQFCKNATESITKEKFFTTCNNYFANTHSGNLFEGLICSSEKVLDPIVRAAGFVDPDRRKSAAYLANLFELIE